MSPEQVLGDPSMIDTRSDVCSLGVVRYEMLAEKIPYPTLCKTQGCCEVF